MYEWSVVILEPSSAIIGYWVIDYLRLVIKYIVIKNLEKITNPLADLYQRYNILEGTK